MKKILKGMLSFFMVLAMSKMMVMAAEPKVMVTDYKIKEEKVKTGQEFDLSIVLKNTAKKNVKNMKVTVVSETGEILPTKGAGTAYIEQIDAETEETLTFSMIMDGAVQEKSYKMLIKLAYEDGNGYSYNVEESIYLPVQVDLRYELSDEFVEGELVVGEMIEITGKINNTGSGTLYNVKVRVKGENVNEYLTSVGNIEPGKSGKYTLPTTINHVTEGTLSSNYLVVTYEDRQGNVYGEDEKEYISYLKENEIVAPEYSDLVVVKEEKKPIVSKTVIGWIVIAIFFVILVGVNGYKKRKRKKEVLEAFE